MQNLAPRVRQSVSVLIATVLVAGVLTSSASAQGTSASERNEVLTTKDNWPLYITYYRPKGEDDKETPVVILLHGKGGNRLVWAQGFAKSLQDRGFAVVAVDLRKHGESIPAGATGDGGGADLTPVDHTRMVTFDLEAVKRFLLEEHQAERLNMRKTAIIGADLSAAVAMNFAVLDWQKRPYDDAPTVAASTPRGQDIRALVLLSPEATVSGLAPSVRAAAELRNPLWGVAVLTVYSSGDRQDRGTSKKIHTQLRSDSRSKDNMYLQSYRGAWRGTDLLGKKGIDVDALMVGFLEKHLKALNGPVDKWRNRKSRLSN